MAAEEKTAVAAESDEKEDGDYFLEEYLGDDEIDEDQIISAEEPEEFPDLTTEDEKELDFLVSEEEQELSQLDSLEDEEFVANTDDEIIELDPGEDDLIRGSLEGDSLTETDGELQLDQAVPEDPLFERNFNALDEEQGAFTSDGLDSGSLEETGAVSDTGETGGQSITLEGPLGAESEGEGGEKAMDGDSIWEPETPPSFVAQPNEEFPPREGEEPLRGW